VFKSLQKYKRPLQTAAVTLVLAASFALTWYTVHAPAPGRDARAVSMETDSAAYFATERDFSALAQDAKSGAALSIGLSAEYALVNLKDGGRYYVRIDTQRPLVAEVVKERLAAETPAVFALTGVQPPASPIASAARYLNNPSMFSLIGTVLILGCMIWLMGPMMRSGGFSAAQRPSTRFRDVVGVEEAKEALQDIVAYLKNPAQFSELGAKPPKGVVLEGHFGAGKTLLARAVAGEAGVPFIPLAGGDFTDMFLGVGVRRVRKLFEMARRSAPCVVFIDEIEGIGRRSSGGGAAETENNRIINTLLVELDGFAESSGIVVLGATNNVRTLDPAMIRPGRFDRTCAVGLPDIAEREALFGLYAGKLKVEGKTDFRQLARISTGLSPAAIANVVNAAALLAAKEDAPSVGQDHFHRVLEQHLLGGPATAGAAALDAAGRHRIAVHEAGHAVVAKLLKVGIVEKVSILKRGRSLGATLVTTDCDPILQSEPDMRARMTMLMGGRGAEALVLGSISTGAANDLEHVSKTAYRMVTEFGFSRNMGPFSYAGLPDQERRITDHPEAIAEAREIVKEIERECAALLAANRIALERLTAALLEHETVSGEVVEACVFPKAEQPLSLAA
jgi:cell division protease FtsH